MDVTADRDGGATSPLSVRSPARQQARVLDYLRIGREEGAEVVIGGGRLGGEAYDRGFFVEPTIFDRVAPECESPRRRSSTRCPPSSRVDQYVPARGQRPPSQPR
ncbi:aldehyde dehydrogenase family protein [Streptomyces sp. NPDC004752]